MKKHMIPKNSYLSDDTVCYYNRDYIGYQKHGNPDFINRLKNMTGRYDELDLVRDFLKVFDLAYKDIPQIIDEEHLENCAVAIIPRSKAEKTYVPSQLIFKKAISCVAGKLNLYNATDAIRRVIDTKNNSLLEAGKQLRKNAPSRHHKRVLQNRFRSLSQQRCHPGRRYLYRRRLCS